MIEIEWVEQECMKWYVISFPYEWFYVETIKSII